MVLRCPQEGRRRLGRNKCLDVWMQLNPWRGGVSMDCNGPQEGRALSSRSAWVWLGVSLGAVMVLFGLVNLLMTSLMPRKETVVLAGEIAFALSDLPSPGSLREAEAELKKVSSSARFEALSSYGGEHTYELWPRLLWNPTDERIQVTLVVDGGTVRSFKLTSRGTYL